MLHDQRTKESKLPNLHGATDAQDVTLNNNDDYYNETDDTSIVD